MRIGIDLGGTKIEGLALADDGRELARTRMPSPRGNYSDTLGAIVTVVESLEREAGTRGTVGVGIPGALSPATGLVKNANSTWLNGKSLAQDLPRLLNRPVRFANDANCFALSEATDGAAADASTVFGVIAGTGIGGGLVVNGRVVVGANAIAGEWGHNPMPPSSGGLVDPPTHCYCGRQGCIETYLSGPAFERDYGQGVRAAIIADRARAGEPDARSALERYADRMARALGTVINILDPEVIALGGGLSNITMLYSLVPERWAPYVFSDQVATRLVPAKHGDSSGVRGAAWLWPSE
jgi:fructokinase